MWPGFQLSVVESHVVGKISSCLVVFMMRGWF